MTFDEKTEALLKRVARSLGESEARVAQCRQLMRQSWEAAARWRHDAASGHSSWGSPLVEEEAAANGSAAAEAEETGHHELPGEGAAASARNEGACQKSP